MLKKMGWGGAGLGAKEQGIEQPISGGEVGVIPVSTFLSDFNFIATFYNNCILGLTQCITHSTSLISDS